MSEANVKPMPYGTLTKVKPEDAAHVWPLVEPWIKAANDFGGGRWLPHDWLTKVLAGQSDMYVGRQEGFVLFVEVVNWPRSRELVVALFGGEGDHDYAAIDQALVPIARIHQCNAIQIDGRPGWRKTLKTLSYELTHCSWRKEITHARR